MPGAARRSGSAILGGIGLVAFAIVFLRLWYLEVLSGDQYLAEAQNNQVREFTVQAPRGEILDRDGEVLVDNRTALALQVKPTELPKSHGAPRAAVRPRRARSPACGPQQIRKRDPRGGEGAAPACPATLRATCPTTPSTSCARTRQRFPGVSVERVYVRQYPQGDARRPPARLRRRGRSTEELDDPRYEALEPGDEIGQDGVEYAYDSLLRGVNGASRVQVDAAGQPTGGRLTEREPETGQRPRALDRRRGPAAPARRRSPTVRAARRLRRDERPHRRALGARLGPDLRPVGVRQAAAPAVESRRDLRRPDEDRSAPAAFNRATQGAYPTGSTFKPITALARARLGRPRARTRSSTTPARSTLGDGNVLHNAGDAVYGPIDLREALQVSSDVFFYTLGCRMDDADNADGGALQDWARKLGLGEPTGIDIGGEAAGLLPTPGGATRPTRRTPPGLGLRRGGLPRRGRGHRPPVVGRRQRQPRGRPGRPAGRPAADGGRLRGDRQRRRPRHARTSACASRTRRAGRSRRSTRRSATHVDIDPTGAADDPGRPARRRDGAGRHLLPRLRRLSRSRSPARPAPPSAPGHDDQSWYVAARAVRRPEVRGRGDDRARRLRRRLRGPGGAGDPQRSCFDVNPSKIESVGSTAAATSEADEVSRVAPL